MVVPGVGPVKRKSRAVLPGGIGAVKALNTLIPVGNSYTVFSRFPYGFSPDETTAGGGNPWHHL